MVSKSGIWQKGYSVKSLNVYHKGNLERQYYEWQPGGKQKNLDVQKSLRMERP